ncbi:hypothetical protein ACTMSW_24555 [Micromonospora sp. BQ11]|uniref:hypothetical protein n=1 Tax=Micromonospora sp. BQ11 TaxID=3452212 RepID=UPI003F8A94B9
MTALLVGGLVTLAVTCVVQFLVVPRVQDRVRRSEQWEKNVTELLVVLEEELPLAARRLYFVVTSFRAVQSVEARLQALTAPNRAHSEQYMQAVKAAYDEMSAVDDVMAKVRLLVERIALVRPEALYWEDLRFDVLVLKGELFGLHPIAALRDKVDDAAYSSRLAAVEKALNAVLERLKIVSVPMKPPATRKRDRIPKQLDTPEFRAHRSGLGRIVR